MVLSIVIVNYNVRQFLEQCLASVKRAIDHSPRLNGFTEVFVVDNASSDGSREFLSPLFPWVHFSWNTENKGFSRANNQALPLASGKYVLFLNPDTLVSEDSLEQCVFFMENHPDAGAAGVRMVNGKGIFLKESKRGFPSLRASFFKLSGITALFPRSRFFAGYYLGHLDEEETHPVAVLSGAFMMVRKEILDRIGNFDERFFMYAEDIDLSYRITNAGYRNYYIASVTIIHFKGESTPKDQKHLNLFYGAMLEFVRKYNPKRSNSVYIYFMKTAIRFRAFIASLQR
jgi:N-acetylglucosaminyl-diphospho-decaprenol L-rhamnosyltransferase